VAKRKLKEFACTLRYCKLEEEVDAELADINVPEQKMCLKPIYEVITLKKLKFK
jgi:hypothetical protein